jgi:hypothetical protein
VIPRRTFAEETHRTSVDHVGRVDRRRTLYLRTKTELGVFRRARDPGLRLMEACKHFLGVVSDG